MMNWAGKRYWLIGASDGLGEALAHKLSAAGAEVIVSARSEDKLAALVDALPGKARAVAVDVSNLDNVTAAAAAIGEIDGMVFLAGVYWPFKAQDWDAQQAEAMADVNFTGAVRSVGAVINQMVARDAGHIVLTGSLSGFRGLPGAIGYSAAKAGVMALGESLQADLAGTGVRVQIANPGFIKTRLTAKNDFKMPFIMTPEEAAQEMFELMCDDGAYVRHFPRAFSLLFRASRFFPHWLYHRIFA
ncbi:SDR family NAD(P)-dependent oxidoreductase [Roseovarius sp. LXJ103]|uniref:SDR family NAD(P)-dependent oxidoreductase n=1 Tax=Roseovarius carneus TaxID=2853164 RepID=UPI000D6071F5|nr:SDR family NAD(P)-dependent oxidoreductase [Roseovarius carneus]MBZ8117966.1 SDR family NAD(P)-dependent oxidoreductase [Roseovarius carneus]PWE36282.1 short-chain dehydrogenase [Pelagicola sp. LXJ1103]